MKKNIFGYFGVVFMCFLTVLIAGCDKNTPDCESCEDMCSVTFISEGIKVNELSVKVGSQLLKPILAPRDGFVLYGWCIDEELKNVWDFVNFTVIDNITLYAKWIEKENNNPPDTWAVIVNGVFGNGGFDSHIHCIAYGNGSFVAGGNSKKISYSTDGKNWVAGIDNTNNATAYLAATYGNGKFITSNYNKMLYSTDGKNWTAGSNQFTPYVLSIAYGNGKFVAAGLNAVYGNVTTYRGEMAYSIDGKNWTSVEDNILDSFDGSGIQTIAFGNGKFVAGGDCRDGGHNSKIVYSTNGENWTFTPNNTFFHNGNIIRDIAYGNGRFVVVCSDGVAYSLDGINWIAVANTTFNENWVSAVAYGSGYFVAVGDRKIAYSTDGENWEIVTKSVLDDYLFNDIVYGDGKFVAVGANGRIAYSNTIE